MKSSPRTTLLAGFVGGVAAASVVAGILAATGDLGAGTRTVTIERSPIVSTAGAQGVRALTARAVYERDAAGVVSISASGVERAPSTAEMLRGESGQQGTATGSGFEIDGRGSILTNWHVVAGAKHVTVRTARGASIGASVVALDERDDLALLRIPSGVIALHPLPLGDSAQTRIGDAVYAIGDPFGLGGTLTAGIVSALGRRVPAPGGGEIGDVLQTDAPINPGNSGGPLLNADGDVIAINSQIETSGGGSVGIAFAVPIDTAERKWSIRGDGSAG